MRNLFNLVLMFSVFSSNLFALDNSYIESHSFEEAINDYQKIQKEIEDILKTKIPSCINNIGNLREDIDRCRVMNYCKIFQDRIDSPNFYEGQDGIIPNPRYFKEQNILLNCLKDKYRDEIEAKLEEFNKNNKNKNLKEVYDLNTLLTMQLKKSGELDKYAQVNQELVNLQLKASMGSDEVKVLLVDQLKLAQKNTKISLSKKTIDLILKIDQKANDKKYLLESEKFEASLTPALKTNSKFLNLKNFTEEIIAGGEKELIENQKKYQERAKYVYGVFEEVKKDYIDFLNSKKNTTNKNEIERAIQRISLVKFKRPILSKDFMAACEMPNAWLLAEDNTITMCPGWFDRPWVFIYETFAHEFSHSIDSCYFSAPLQIKNSSIEAVEEGSFDLNMDMNKINNSKIKYFEIDSKDLKVQDQKPLEIVKNPFLKSIKCLMGESSIEALYPDKEKIKKSMEVAISGLRKIGRANSDDAYFQFLNFSKENVDTFMKYYGLCDLPHKDGKSQLEESFADQIATEMLAKKLSQMPKNKAQEEMSKLVLSDLNSGDMLCPKGIIQNKIKAKREEMGCDKYFSNMSDKDKMTKGLILSSDYNSDPHPVMSSRYDRIIFAHPQIRSILDCRRDGVKYCEN